MNIEVVKKRREYKPGPDEIAYDQLVSPMLGQIVPRRSMNEVMRILGSIPKGFDSSRLISRTFEVVDDERWFIVNRVKIETTDQYGPGKWLHYRDYDNYGRLVRYSSVTPHQTSDGLVTEEVNYIYNPVDGTLECIEHVTKVLKSEEIIIRRMEN